MRAIKTSLTAAAWTLLLVAGAIAGEYMHIAVGCCNYHTPFAWLF